jgi:hypothetical protein
MVMIDVARSVSIAGKATLTMDSSMLAMLDARIVAISTQGLTQGLAPAARFAAARVDWIIASSHGLVLRDDIVVGVPRQLHWRRLFEAQPKSALVHSRRLRRLAATSAIAPNADICLRRNICRNGHFRKSPNERQAHAGRSFSNLSALQVLMRLSTVSR